MKRKAALMLDEVGTGRTKCDWPPKVTGLAEGETGLLTPHLGSE